MAPLESYGIMRHMKRKAERIFRERLEFADGGIVEMTIWRVPEPVPPTDHGLKYSLFYGFPGRRVIGYDNERGKGDHRHIHGAEEPYRFESVEKLIADFLADVRAKRNEA